MFGEMFGGFGKLWGQMKQSAEDRKLAEKNREQQMKMLETLDFEPMYASQNVPTFKKSESPIARSYLESFLLGNNPDATFSAAPNAKAIQASQQKQQNAWFGTPEERVARAKQVQQETPWKVTTPTRPVVGEKEKEAAMVVNQPNLSESGLNTEQVQELVNRGYIKEGQDLGTLYYPGGALSNAMKAGDWDAVKRLVEGYQVKTGALGLRQTNKKSMERLKDAIDKYNDQE